MADVIVPGIVSYQVNAQALATFNSEFYRVLATNPSFDRALIGVGRYDQGYRVTGKLELDPRHRRLYSAGNEVLDKAMASYTDLYKQTPSITGEAAHFLSYVPGGFYKEHADFMAFSGPENIAYFRVATAIFYINADYEGGELEFSHFGVTVKPRAGQVLVFPSGHAYAHVAHPVLSGTKYVFLNFFRHALLPSVPPRRSWRQLLQRGSSAHSC